MALSPLQELHDKRAEVEFGVAMCSLTILRYLTDYVGSLPLGLLTRLVSSNDTLMALLPLLEQPPWERRRKGKVCEWLGAWLVWGHMVSGCCCWESTASMPVHDDCSHLAISDRHCSLSRMHTAGALCGQQVAGHRAGGQAAAGPARCAGGCAWAALRQGC